MTANYFSKGQWNIVCDLCGEKVKSGDTVKTWDNFRVCRKHREVRNPQDFVRGVRDNQTVPFSRPQPPEQRVVSNFRLLKEDGGAILLENLDYLLRT